MSDMVRVGLIGVGSMGTIHARNLLMRISGATLIGMASPHLNTQRLPFVVPSTCKIELDYRNLLCRKDLDAIVIAAASTTHEEILQQVLERKVPVFCEKPIALSFDTALKLHWAFEQNDLFIQMGFMRRYDPHYTQISQLIQDGAIGIPFHFNNVSRDRIGAPLEVLSRSGGIYRDMGVHDFDLAHWMMDTEITSVFARGGRFTHVEYSEMGDVDHAHVSFQCRSNALGLIELGREAVFGYDIRTEIMGTKGTLQLADVNSTGSVLLIDGQIIRDTYNGYAERFQNAYFNELQDFVESVRLGRRPQVTSLDGIRATAVAEAASAAAVSGKVELVNHIV